MKHSHKADGRPSFQFYPDDWLSDAALPLCSLAAQGLWMHLLCRMWTSPDRGLLLKANGSRAEAKDVARWASIPEAEAKQLLSELEAEGVCSTLPEGTVYNRRMRRDEKQRRSKAEAGRIGGRVSKPPSRSEAKGGPSTPTPSSSPTSVPPKPPKGDRTFPVWFDELWDMYPGRDKTPTYEKCKRLTEGGEPIADLIAAAKHYRDDAQRKPDFTKSGERFYGRKGHWKDYVSSCPSGKKKDQGAGEAARVKAHSDQERTFADDLEAARVLAAKEEG